jgi:hypothetical protein
MAFPSTNITLKQVCDAYGVPYNMAALRGKYYYTVSPPSALQQVPLTGPISLSLFLGKAAYTGPQTNGPNVITSLGNISYPPNAPIPASFTFTLIGGGGGGGGGGGAIGISSPGGAGGGGANVTPSTNLTFDINQNIAVTSLPNGGPNGFSGQVFGRDSSSGGAGSPAVLTYNSVTYTAGGGGGGGAGANGDGGGSVGSLGAGGIASPSGTNGGNATGQTSPGSPNGGAGGAGGGSLGDGADGTPGGAGSISITWIYY